MAEKKKQLGGKDYLAIAKAHAENTDFAYVQAKFQQQTTKDRHNLLMNQDDLNKALGSHTKNLQKKKRSGVIKAQVKAVAEKRAQDMKIYATIISEVRSDLQTASLLIAQEVLESDADDALFTAVFYNLLTKSDQPWTNIPVPKVLRCN